MDNQSLSHVRWKCQYHIVFIPKYRKKILYGKLKSDVREIISILCKYKDVQIIDGAVCEDHIHLSVAIPPKISISSFMGFLKGKSSLMIYEKWGNLKFKYRNREFWFRGYYVDTAGKNAVKIKDINGKLLIVGISSMFILQSIFNIFVNLNLVPEASFNLPFVSYGRLNLIVNMMCLSLI